MASNEHGKKCSHVVGLCLDALTTCGVYLWRVPTAAFNEIANKRINIAADDTRSVHVDFLV